MILHSMPTAIVAMAAATAPPFEPELNVEYYLGVSARITSIFTSDDPVDVALRRSTFNLIRSQAGVAPGCDQEGLILVAISGVDASLIGLPPLMPVMIEEVERDVYALSLEEFAPHEVLFQGIDGVCP